MSVSVSVSVTVYVSVYVYVHVSVYVYVHVHVSVHVSVTVSVSVTVTVSVKHAPVLPDSARVRSVFVDFCVRVDLRLCDNASGLDAETSVRTTGARLLTAGDNVSGRSPLTDTCTHQ